MPKISVIIPVYNVENYLKDCIDSVLAQTFTDFELILVDDGSPDKSGLICDEYSEKDSRIRVFHQENQGQAAARNFGVTKAATDWICFVDSDDVIHPQMLSTLFGAVENSDVKISMALLSESVSKEKISEIFSDDIDKSLQIIDVCEDVLFEFFKDSRYHSVCAKLIQKDLLIKYPFQVGRIHEDSPVICKWLVEAGRIAYSPNVFYVYIDNGDSTTRSKFTLKKLDLLWAWEQQIKFYKSIGFKKMQKILEYYYFVSAAKFYKKIRESKDINQNEAQKLKRYTLKKYFSILFCKQFPLNERLYYFEFFSVKTAMIFWVILGYVNKFKNKINADNAN